MKNPKAFGKSVLMIVVGLCVAADSGVLPQPLYAQSDIQDVVIFATNSIRFDDAVAVESGNVVVNDFSLNPLVFCQINRFI